jgi:hypothetical protein
MTGARRFPPGRPGVALGLAVLLVAVGCTGSVRSDQRADVLRSQLDGLLTPAVSTLADLRIAARRGDVAELPKLAAPLPRLGVKLQRFQKAHR